MVPMHFSIPKWICTCPYSPQPFNEINFCYLSCSFFFFISFRRWCNQSHIIELLCLLFVPQMLRPPPPPPPLLLFFLHLFILLNPKPQFNSLRHELPPKPVQIETILLWLILSVHLAILNIFNKICFSLKRCWVFSARARALHFNLHEWKLAMIQRDRVVHYTLWYDLVAVVIWWNNSMFECCRISEF